MEGLIYEQETYKIRGACFKIWKEFGGAFKESVVENALKIELEELGFKVESQKRFPIYYKNQKVGIYIPDIIIDNKINVTLIAFLYKCINENKKINSRVIITT